MHIESTSRSGDGGCGISRGSGGEKGEEEVEEDESQERGNYGQAGVDGKSAGGRNFPSAYVEKKIEKYAALCA